MTDKEREALMIVCDAWNALNALPCQHPDDISDFRFHIHAIQHLIMSRPTFRELQHVGM